MAARKAHAPAPLILIGGLAGAALIAGAVVQAQPLMAFAVPAVLASGVLFVRRPAPMLLIVLLLAAANSSVQAFLGFDTGPLVNVLLAGLWAGVLISHAIGERSQGIAITLGLALVSVYALITFLSVLTAPSISLGFLSFRTSTWFLLVVVVLGIAGWRLGTYGRIAKAFVLSTLFVGGYAAFRLIVGAAGEEEAFARGGTGLYNVIDDQLALIGSFSSRHYLAFWCTCAGPFCFAAVLVLRGRWRPIAAVATALCVIAMFGTGVRVAVPAMAFGALIVIALFQLSGGLQGGRRLTQTAVASLAAITVGAASFAFVVGEDSADRYAAILNPEGDFSYENRIRKWEAALRDIDEHPFGQGLGSAGVIQERGLGGYINQASYGLDSSYLKIAFEQGFLMLGLFAAAMLGLLAELCRSAIRSRQPLASGLCMAAAGTLTAGLTMFMTAQYIEGIPTLAMWVPVGIGVGAIASTRRERRTSQLSGERLPGSGSPHRGPPAGGEQRDPSAGGSQSPPTPGAALS